MAAIPDFAMMVPGITETPALPGLTGFQFVLGKQSSAVEEAGQLISIIDAVEQSAEQERFESLRARKRRPLSESFQPDVIFQPGGFGPQNLLIAGRRGGEFVFSSHAMKIEI